ncbi:MAG: hypothetical protein ACRDRW_16130 [Pseudonocardiaceae bacterium]
MGAEDNDDTAHLGELADRLSTGQLRQFAPEQQIPSRSTMSREDLGATVSLR